MRALDQFIADADIGIRRAAVLRLGEIGGPEAVKALGEVFKKEPRSAGTDIDAGVRADVVAMLAKLGTPEARAALLNSLQSWLRAGPEAPGDYAHIYDKQYFSVAVAAIKALEPYDDEETRALVRSIADDSSLFYALREAAWRTSLRREMAKKGLQAPAERAAFLVAQIDPEGVLVEQWWTGKKPGDKTNAAALEAVLENMVHEVGWPAAGPLQEVLRIDPSREPRRTLAAARMLADLVLSDFRMMKNGKPEARHRDAILTVVGALAALPQEALAPESGSQVFGQLAAAGEGLDDEGVWIALRELAPKITIPNAWIGEAPNAQEIGVALPSDPGIRAGVLSSGERSAGRSRRGVVPRSACRARSRRPPRGSHRQESDQKRARVGRWEGDSLDDRASTGASGVPRRADVRADGSGERGRL